jgi:hypothetical protein
MHTIPANSYVAYRSLRFRLANTIWPPELDPLSALIVRYVWVNGSSVVVDEIRAQLAIPRSTLSSALGRLETRGFVRRRPNPVDARYVVVSSPGPERPLRPPSPGSSPRSRSMSEMRPAIPPSAVLTASRRCLPRWTRKEPSPRAPGGAARGHAWPPPQRLRRGPNHIDAAFRGSREAAARQPPTSAHHRSGRRGLPQPAR